jgi:hypothetical protein
VLYRFYDFTGTLVRVGKTGDLRARIGAYLYEDSKKPRDEQWWDTVAFILIQRYRNPDILHHAEQHAIATEHPVFNEVGRRPRQSA